jgi:phage protein D
VATTTSSSNEEVGSCIVKFDGSTSITGDDGNSYETKDGYYIRRVEVDMREGAPNFFSVEINVHMQSELVMVDCFKPGMEIEIALGRGEEGLICRGEVSYVEPRLGNREHVVVLSGYDKSHRLTRGTESRTWASSDAWTQDQQFDQFIKDVITKSQGREGQVSHGLSADVDSITAKVEYFAQYESNDWQVLQGLGLATGLARDPKDFDTAGKISVKRVDPTASPVVTICREKSDPAGSPLAEEAKFRLSVVRQLKKVEVRGWDHKQKQAIKGEATDLTSAFEGDTGIAMAAQNLYGGSASGSTLTITDSPVSSKDEADQLAQAILDQLGMEFMRGEVTVQGDARLTPGDIVELKGYGTRYSGNWLITGVLHEHLEGQYKSYLELARNAAPSP